MAKNERRHLLLITIVLVCLALVVVLGWCIFSVYNMAKETASGSYIASVDKFLQEEPNIAIEIATNLGERWRFLNKEEYIKLAKVMSKSHAIDRGRLSNKPDKILYDQWNQHIIIAGRKLFGTRGEYIVWSKGPDKIWGTQDDITFPYEATIPKELIGKK